ncbi:MAG: hypothetical protein K8T25_15720 [Planctomycetia bacterium]|nr:hypothetical protein [Planctomycetia bacterium]
MTGPLDLMGDFPHAIDGTEAVTLHRRGDGQTATVAGALRRSVERHEAAPGEGSIVAADVRWHLPVVNLTDPPAIGDQLLDASGGVWTVLDVRAESCASRWVCRGRDLTITHGLTERVDIERATWTKDAAGAAVPHWHVWRAGLRVRLQPHDLEIRVAAGRREAVAGYRAYFAEHVDIDQECRLVAADGQAYRVVAYHPAESFGQLSVVEAIAAAD